MAEKTTAGFICDNRGKIRSMMLKSLKNSFLNKVKSTFPLRLNQQGYSEPSNPKQIFVPILKVNLKRPFMKRFSKKLIN